MYAKKYSHLKTFETVFSDLPDNSIKDESFWEEVIKKVGQIRNLPSNKDIMMDIGDDYIYFGITLGNVTWNISFHDNSINDNDNNWDFSARFYPDGSHEKRIDDMFMVNDITTMASFLAVILL